MNPPDSFCPPDPNSFLDEATQAEINRRFRDRLLMQERQRRRQQQRRMAEREKAEISSDSEIDGLANTVKGKMELTPAGSTPQELVKLDPSEIGMSAGYKHL